MFGFRKRKEKEITDRQEISHTRFVPRQENEIEGHTRYVARPKNGEDVKKEGSSPTGQEKKELEILQNTYEILESIGAGSGGTVYRAFHKRLKKMVVLKKISDEAKENLDSRMEADILKNLRHSYLPQVLDFLELDNAIYTVMDYIAGDNFEQLLESGRQFTQNQVIKYARELCEALVYLHSQTPPIIHADIKPANIMLTPDDDICLIDFNISNFLKKGKEAVIACTPGYASPEQNRMLEEGLNGGKTEESLDVRTDIYSLGATLCHLVTGQKPSGDYKKTQIRISEHVSETFAVILNKAMQLNPADRYQSAAEMLQALRSIAKSDKRYRSLIRRQRLACALCALLFAGSIGLTFAGFGRMEQEKQAAYAENVKVLEEIKDETLFEQQYQTCIAIEPEAPEAYYAKAKFLYDNYSYEQAYAFVQDVMRTHAFSQPEILGDLHYILAGCRMELGDYEEAGKEYETALSYNQENSNYYRDYAIILAQTGEIEKAETVLNKAQELGLAEDSIYLASGEIASALNHIDSAKENFENCITSTDDDYNKFRAYVMWSRLYDQGDKSEEKYLEKINVLSRAQNELPKENQALICEKIVQTYIDLNGLTQNEAYLRDALGTLDQIVANGWGSYNTHNNIAAIRQQLGDYEGAEGELRKILEEYDESYDIYKQLAFIEIQKQSDKAQEEKDYKRFYVYYKKSKELFASSGKTQDSDMEMAVLEQAYQQIADGNWLDE